MLVPIPDPKTRPNASWNYNLTESPFDQTLVRSTEPTQNSLEALLPNAAANPASDANWAFMPGLNPNGFTHTKTNKSPRWNFRLGVGAGEGKEKQIPNIPHETSGTHGKNHSDSSKPLKEISSGERPEAHVNHLNAYELMNFFALLQNFTF